MKEKMSPREESLAEQNLENTGKNGKKKFWVYVVLHASFFFSSLSGLCAKMAGRQSDQHLFLAWYAADLLIMGIYAVVWQQVLKRLPLTTAYANKPIGLIWGMLWGSLVFHEKITIKMLVGAAVIFIGIYMEVTSDE